MAAIPLNSEKNPALKAENYRLLYETFAQKYISVVQVDIHTGNTLILKSDLDAELVGTCLPWWKLLERYADRRIFFMDREIVMSLTLERLILFYKKEEPVFPLEVRCNSSSKNFQWVEIAASPIRIETDTLLITTRNIDETIKMRSIVDLFVYRNYDYLVLIDTKDNSYIRFTGNKGATPVPPEMGDDYTQDMIRHNRKYVVPEDFERVVANMRLPHVKKMLEQSDLYSFTSGGVTYDGKYLRSRIIFLYYDRAAGLLLNAQTDVTQIYLEEQVKNAQLAAALRDAQHDPLTDLYNPKATADLIKRSLENQYRNLAAFFFLDVDNFKRINDTLGHQEGDKVLCFLARSVQQIAGRVGIAGRIGGDEFLLYLPALSSVDEVREKAHQICKVFELLDEELLRKEMPSCSVGISVYPFDGTDYDTLLRKADYALYHAKEDGKSRYSFYSIEALQQ